MGRSRHIAVPVLSFIVALAVAPAAFGQASPPPTFSKAFLPDTIGPGSVSTLTFTIDNASGTAPATMLAFTDTLPAGVTVANPATASTTCTGGTLTANAGGGTISYSGGAVGAGSSCTIQADVTAIEIDGSDTTYMNTSGDLTSNAGNSGTATANLDVDVDRPGFAKSFAPSTVPLGDRSTLTFTVANTLNVSVVQQLDFTDNLPVGMVIADPANASTTCSQPLLPATLIAAPGSGVITLDANGIVSFPVMAAGATCTVTVDVVATGSGTLGNVSNELIVDITGLALSAGKASATLDVTVTPIALRKSFTDDPVPPGQSVTLEFTIDNFDRNFSATGIAFTDDLTTLVPAVPGLTFGSLLSNDCGGSLSGVGGTTIGFTGGTLGPESFCTVRVSLSVPAGATPGKSTNTTGAISATVDGVPVVGNMASDALFVEPVPFLTKLFVGDPVGAGGTVTLRFTVTNTSTTGAATSIAFIDELTTFLPSPVSVTLPPVPDPPCGAGSSLSLGPLGIGGQGLSLTGGSLAAAPGAGSSCTFDVTLTIPVGFPAGVYVNTTEEVTATVGGTPYTGSPASDDLVVVAAPTLLKEFTDDPVDPGGTVTLQFTLAHGATAPGPATAVGFTDPLPIGLTATGLPNNDACGAANGTLSGTTTLTFSGATLTPGQVCTFSVTLSVPGGAAAGSHTNTTSAVTATVLGVTTTGNPASDDLQIATLTLTKEFTDDPVIAGGTANLRFTLSNASAVTATSIQFTDSLAALLPGTPDFTFVGLPASACGGTLTSVISTFFSFAGGTVLANGSCSFDVTVMVPAGTADGAYLNVTSGVLSSLGIGDPAVDALIVNSGLLDLTKEFTNDPVAPGGSVTLQFTLTNQAAGAVSTIAFTDNLDAALAGLVATGLPIDVCGGTVATADGGMTIGLTGGSLGASGQAGDSCSFSLTLQVPPGATAGTATNTTSAVSGLASGSLAVTGDPATDQLRIGSLVLSKAFDGPTEPGGSPVLTFTIQNLDATTGISELGFTDDLDAVLPGLVATGLPVNDVCGVGSSLTGTSLLAMANGSLGPGGTCSFDVTLAVPFPASAGTFTNTTSELIQRGVPIADPATADLVIKPLAELVHGFVEGGSLAALPGPVENRRFYLLDQKPYSSYEVVVDEISGDVQPLILDLLASDETTVLQSAQPVGGAGASLSLRLENAGAAAVSDQQIVVGSGGCTTDCGADDTYRLRFYETTYSIPRFHNSATQQTILIMQNARSYDIPVSIHFWGEVGNLLGTHSATITAHGILVLDTSTLGFTAGTSGAITVSNKGRYGALSGKAVALEPASGFSFETSMMPRPK